MKTRNELLTSIATTIQDYRAGEISKPTPAHVDRWVKQFDVAVQLPLLSELDHVLDKTYFSKAVVSGFFENQIQQQKIAGDNPCAFWQRANFLNIQAHGQSQAEILGLFNAALLEKCGIAIDDCGSEDVTCRVSSDQSQLDSLVSVNKSFFKPAMNSAGVR